MLYAMAPTPLLLHQWIEGKQGTFFHPFSLTLLLFFTIFLLKLNGAKSKKSYLPPSPPKLPFIGNLHQVGTLAHRSFRDLSLKYGPLMLLYLGHAPTLIVSSAQMAREILKDQDINFANRPPTTAAKIFLYGFTNISFAPYGEYWRQVRKICITELLSIKRVQTFKFIREEEVTVTIEKIHRSCSLGEPINLSEIAVTLSNNIVSRCVLGKTYEDDNKNRFGELSKELMKLMGAFSFGDFFPLLGWMDTLTGLVSRQKEVSQELDTFFDRVIDEHLAQSKHDDPDNKKDFVDLLLRVQKDQTLGINLTRYNIKAIILDMFVAGTDTSSTTIEWAMAELVNNPNTMKKSQEEVRKVVGKKSKVEEEDIHLMNYLRSVVKETFRLHPPAPMLIPRVSSAIITNVKGYHIPDKTRVLVNAWAIQRDPKIWEEPEVFNPERFSSITIDYKGQDFDFLPFGSGRRGCPGMSFGLAVVEFVVANLLYWFDWELPGGDANKKELDMTEEFGLTVGKKSPLHLIPKSQFF